MPGKHVNIDDKKEVGGFNPERRADKKKPQVGPTPTDDPHGKADKNIKRKIEERGSRLPPD